jgi:hypothetical protein
MQADEREDQGKTGHHQQIVQHDEAPPYAPGALCRHCPTPRKISSSYSGTGSAIMEAINME